MLIYAPQYWEVYDSHKDDQLLRLILSRDVIFLVWKCSIGSLYHSLRNGEIPIHVLIVKIHNFLALRDV